MMPPARRQIRLPSAVSLAALGLLLGGGSLSIAASPTTATGLVETVAGPGFCGGPALFDRTSTTVRALAMDAAGTLYYDSGPSAQGVVVKAPTNGQVSTLITSVPADAVAADPLDSARQNSPPASRLVSDGAGGVLVAAGARLIDYNRVTGLTTVAGDPTAAPGSVGQRSSGDGGPARDARFRSIRSVASDEAGNVYLADQVDAAQATVRIRLINRGRVPLTVYAGTPHQLTILPGHIDTIAGVAGEGNAGDGGPALRASLQGVPPSMAVLGRRLYVGLYWRGMAASPPQARVRLVNLSGTPLRANGVLVGGADIATVAGGRDAGFGGDGGGTRAGAIGYVPGLATDDRGDLFLADEQNNRVRRVDASGVITTVAGTGAFPAQAGPPTDNDRLAVEARLDRPYDVKATRDGHQLVIADRLNGEVRAVDSRGVIRAEPGSAAAMAWTCEGGVYRDSGRTPAGPHLPPQTGGTAGVVSDAQGNTYVALADGAQVKKIDAHGVITTVAGSSTHDNSCGGILGCEGFSGDGGPALGARLYRPSALALRPGGGGLYILDGGNARVRFVNLGSTTVTVNGVSVAPGIIRTVAGNGKPGFSGDGAAAVRAQLGKVGNPSGSVGSYAVSPYYLGALAADSGGNLFIADTSNQRVRQVDAAGIITTIAGQDVRHSALACCLTPAGLAVDAAGVLLVADQGYAYYPPHRWIWALNHTGRPVRVLGQDVPPGTARAVAGTGGTGAGFGAEGVPALATPLLLVTGITLDRQGNLYVGELGDGSSGGIGDVRRVDVRGITTTVMGSGGYWFSGDSMKGPLTSVETPAALAVDACGNLLVSDYQLDRVRRLDLGDSPCAPATTAATPRGGGGPGVGLFAGLAVGSLVLLTASAALLAAGLRRRHRQVGS